MTAPVDPRCNEQHSFLVGFIQPLFAAIGHLDPGLVGPSLDGLVPEIDLSDPLARYQLDPNLPLWKRVDEVDPRVALRAPGLSRPANYSALGIAAESSETVLDAFRLCQRHFALLYQGSDRYLIEERPTVYRLSMDSESLPHAVTDFVHTWFCGAYRYLAGGQLGVGGAHRYLAGEKAMAQSDPKARVDEFVPVAAQLRRPAPQPQHLPAYQAVFGRGVRFGAPRCQLDFPRDAFERARPLANPMLLAFSEQLVSEAVSKGIEGAFAQKVGRVIENLLPEGEPRLHGVAAHLHMSSRSLQRRLELEGISFGEIRQHTKLKLARLYLEQSSKSMSDIAYLLGFSSHSSFSRAFSVWTGESPSQARASAQLAACPDEQSRFEASA